MFCYKSRFQFVIPAKAGTEIFGIIKISDLSLNQNLDDYNLIKLFSDMARPSPKLQRALNFLKSLCD
jgi:hypothetical protein